MAKHIGIVACSAEGAALCYRTLCAEAPDLMGEHMHTEVSMHLMTGPVYSSILERHGVKCRIPGEVEREQIDRIIFSELVNGIFQEESRLYFNTVIQQMKDQGCDAVVLGCTEIPLLVDPEDCPLPTLDSTRLLARAALNEALNEDQHGGAGDA
jgi:aspartate racemase